MSETLCVLPWMHLATAASGTLRLCCNSIPGTNTDRRDDGKPHRIDREGDPEAFWNGTFMRGVRQTMLAGGRPAACRRCFTEEDAGVRSARQGFNEHFASHRAALVPNADGTAPFAPAYLDLRLGNICNLKCRMCNPYASSQWVDEWHYLVEPLPSEEIKRLSSMTWQDRGEWLDALAPHLGSVEEIYLTGGEPTLARAQDALLDRLVMDGHAGRVTLKYNVNLTNLPDRMVAQWRHFRQVKVNASIDAVGDLNRYIRYPTVWAKVERNLDRLAELAASMNLTVGVHTTVQVYNIAALPDLFVFLRRYPFGRPHLNILNHPDWLNIRVIHEAAKARITADLDRWVAEDGSPEDAAALERVRRYLMSADWGHLRPKLVEMTGRFDNARDQNARDVVPLWTDMVAP